MQLTGFPPIVSKKSRVLVLGSMPSVRSLAQGEYFAHPSNAFWPIMGELVGAGRDLPYRRRVARLRASGIALWDVLKHCERPGSLDAQISAEVPNDFGPFLTAYPGIRAVFFDGQKAAALFRRLVLPQLNLPPGRKLDLYTLPSTSAAHAVPYAKKLAAWQQICSYLD